MRKNNQKILSLLVIGLFFIGISLYIILDINKIPHTSKNSNTNTSSLSLDHRDDDIVGDVGGDVGDVGGDVGGGDVVIVIPPKDAVISPLYSDGYKRLDDLIEISDLIIHCKIKSQVEHEAGFSMISTLDPISIISGDADKSDIKVLQIKDEHILNEKGEYLLFLGKQSDALNEYYVLGYGAQGIFKLENEHIKPVDEIMAFEYKKLSLDDPNDLSNSSNEIDNFIDYVVNFNN